MKKNISINLQGIIFHLEDDGYEVLSRYLHEVKAHFASYQGHEEIVADIEGRIAELFAARISVSKQVITLADVEEMTAKMGRVSDFASAEEEELEAEAAGAAGARPAAAAGTPPRDAEGQPRRLYRDLAHRKVAGVCAGLAQYFMLNPLVVRLVFLALVLLPNLFRHRFPFPGVGLFDRSFDFSGLAVIAYAVLWIALPKRSDAPAPIDTLDLGGSLTGRKLFRDVDAGKVGGVAAGLAAYFRTDVVLVRVLFLLSLFLGGSGFIVYLILWVVVPEARTVSEKMQMRGDAVTLSGIDNSLRSNAFDDDSPAPVGSRSVGTFLEGAARNARPAVSFFGTLIRWAVAGLLILTAGSMLLALAATLGAIVGVLPAGSVRMGTPQSEYMLLHDVQPWSAVVGFLALAIPVLALVLLGLRLALRRPVLGRSGSLLLLGLWVLGLVGTAMAATQFAREYRTRGTYVTTQRFTPVAGNGIVLASRNGEDYFEDVRLRFAPADSGAAPFVEKEFQARGRTQDAARLTAQQSISYGITQQDSTLTFDQGIELNENAPYRSQRLILTLHLPLDKVYRLTPLFIEQIEEEYFTNNRQPQDHREHRARFTRQGKFTCLDCSPADAASGNSEADDDDAVVNLNVDGQHAQVRVDADNVKFSTDPGYYGTGRKTLNNPDHFSEIEAHGGFRVLVRQGDQYRVEAAGRPQDVDDVRFSLDDDRLVVRHRERDNLLSVFDTDHHTVLVTVTLPRLQYLELSAGCTADASGFRGDKLRLEASSGSMARLNVHMSSLELQLSSGSQTELHGEAAELAIDGSSASLVDALALVASRVNVDLSSGSKAQVHATNELKVDLSSGSLVQYAGNPRNIQKDLSSGSSLAPVNE